MITLRVTSNSDGNEYFEVEGINLEDALENALEELGYGYSYCDQDELYDDDDVVVSGV